MGAESHLLTAINPPICSLLTLTSAPRRGHHRFLSRPEWVRQGARLIIRDRSDGHIAGAGFVEHLN